MQPHITDNEMEAIRKSGLDFKNAPAVIKGVSSSQFSVSRHYGGCHAYGHRYHYLPATDELIRDDVLRVLVKVRKADLEAKKREAEERQGQLFG